MTGVAEVAEVAEVAALQDGHSGLRSELSRLDTVFFLISAMVVVDTIGAIAIGGAQAFTWLAVLFVTFFIPSALMSAELGAALPHEGGAYIWVRTALGRFAGSLTSLLYWAGTPIWLGGSVAVVALSVYESFIGDVPTAMTYVGGTAFVGLSTLGSVVPLRFGKWIPTSGAIGQIILLIFFTASVTVYGIRNGIHGVAFADFAPTPTVLITVVPVLIYSFVGVELPATAAEEMIDPRRDIPVAIALAGVSQALMYAIPTLAVLVVLPTKQITSLHGFIDAMKAVNTVYGGSVAADGTATLSGAGLVLGTISALVFIWVLMASGSAWIMGAGRAQAAACLDGAGPRRLGRISPRSGVPVTMGLLSGVASLLTLYVNLYVTDGDNQKYFSVALASAISLIVLAYLLIFPSFIVLRRHADLDRPFRVPGGPAVAWLVTCAAMAWTMLAAVCLLWPGFGTSNPDGALPAGFEGQRLQFEMLILLPIVLVLAACTAYQLATMRAARRAGHADGSRQPTAQP